MNKKQLKKKIRKLEKKIDGLVFASLPTTRHPETIHYKVTAFNANGGKVPLDSDYLPEDDEE